jgi:hypothetical protein
VTHHDHAVWATGALVATDFGMVDGRGMARGSRSPGVLRVMGRGEYR